jgi:hypothetical protein
MFAADRTKARVVTAGRDQVTSGFRKGTSGTQQQGSSLTRSSPRMRAFSGFQKKRFRRNTQSGTQEELFPQIREI